MSQSRFRLAVQSVNTAADAVTERLNGGRLRIYGGQQPGSSDRSPTTSVLVELVFDDPAFKPAVAGRASANTIGGTLAVSSGVPTWFRAVTSRGEPVFDGSVGLEGSGADLELRATAIPAGAEVMITGMTYEHPQAV